ncbi:MAG: SPOR domain-containing protein [Gammaproteobacteria bacterium]
MSKDPRDYKHRAQTRRARQTPGWVWLLVGFLLGAFTVGLLWLKVAPGGDGGWVGVAPAPAGEAGPAAATERAAAAPKPRFDFYTLLPSMEVVVPEEELSEPERPPAEQPSERAAAAPVNYLLQVGSFRKAADADRLKAQLALLGFSSHVQRVEGTGSGTWHRVRTGPFEGAAELRAARQRLEENGHRTLVIRAAR